LQLPTSGGVAIAQHRQTADHIGHPRWGYGIALEQTGVEAKHADHLGSAIARRRQAHIIPQTQIATVPKQN